MLSATAMSDTLDRLDKLNVVWDSPSKDHHGSMPLGNGDIGLNAWIEPNGDICFYISKTDSWDENGRLLKVGKVRVRIFRSSMGTTDQNGRFTPSGAPFRQVLNLRDGTLRAHMGKLGSGVDLRLWVDANRPIIRVEVESQKVVEASVSIESWRTKRELLPSSEVGDPAFDHSMAGNQHVPVWVEPDTIIRPAQNEIGWYHRNVRSDVLGMTAKLQSMEDYMAPDPILGRTFGAVIRTKGGWVFDEKPERPTWDTACLRAAQAKIARFDICVLTKHPSTPVAWLKAVHAQFAAADKVPYAKQRAQHEAWWKAFWNRSWVFVDSNGQEKPEPIFEPSKHPIRIGQDQTGSNAFQGQILRASLWDRALSESELEQVIAARRQDQAPLIPTVTAMGGEMLSSREDLDKGSALTIEAWLKPEKLGGSQRIVDKITPGGLDGFMLDLYPGGTLRFICKGGTLTAKDAVKAGEATHVAAIADAKTGLLMLYVDGKRVAELKLNRDDAAFTVSRAYALQRFTTACAGRGAYPIKFNGSIFTVPADVRPGNADYRQWGAGYWWQNTRFPYISACAAGDFDILKPFFAMYAGNHMRMAKFRTQKHLGHGGAFLNECAYFWGAAFNDIYGWTRPTAPQVGINEGGWHRWEFSGGLELVGMMLDCYEHTGDTEFLKNTLLPFAREILTFYDLHYKTDANGKIVIYPAQAVETWWDCTNPMPTLAGLTAVTRRLREMFEDLPVYSNPPLILPSPEDFDLYDRLWNKLPPVPTVVRDGVRMLAPAEKFANKANSENPELYAVFPYREICVGKPDLQLGIEALKHRWDAGNFGWRQDDIFMAYLGLADEAKEYLVGRARNHDKGSRFPAFWGPNYDWVPDQDHGGVLMRTLQSMLLQTDGKKIILLPAWPKGWNADFKLHAPFQTTVECSVRNGKPVKTVVTPKERAKDLVVAGKG